MIRLLARIFISEYENFQDPQVRKKYGILCGSLGIFWNLLLFALKFIFGTIAASVAMVGDAFNNLSDASTSIVSILGFKLASKKPDPEHPFGHGRLEYIAGLVISFFILIMGVELLRSSVTSFIHPKAVETNLISILVMSAAILVKGYMFLYNHLTARKIKSTTMEAVARDSLSDMVSTSAVIVSIIISRFTTFPVDSVAGIIVAAFIIKTGIESIRETIAPLLGTKPDVELPEKIEAELLSHSPIIGMHDLIVHDYGPGRVMISLHAEVPGDNDIFELHEVIDQAELDIARKFNCAVVIHMDPVDTKNLRLVELKAVIQNIIDGISPELKFHDARIVPGPHHSNLIFDIVKPFDFQMTDSQLKESVSKIITSLYEDINCVITIDSPYC